MTVVSVSLTNLYALRMHLDAVIFAAETEAGVVNGQQPEPGSCPQCGASEEKVTDTSTLDGVKRSRCSVCAAEWER